MSHFDNFHDSTRKYFQFATVNQDIVTLSQSKKLEFDYYYPMRIPCSMGFSEITLPVDHFVNVRKNWHVTFRIVYKVCGENKFHYLASSGVDVYFYCWLYFCCFFSIQLLIQFGPAGVWVLSKYKFGLLLQKRPMIPTSQILTNVQYIKWFGR